jgi:hypothetical protein
MSRNELSSWRKIPIQLALAAAVVTAIGGVIAGATIAGDGDDTVALAESEGRQTERTSTRTQPRARAGMEAIVAEMPAGWPATEAMRQAAEEAPGGAAAREGWRQAAAGMPAGWPATEAMRQAAEAPQGGAAARENWRQAVERMPAGWPATEVMRRAAVQRAGFRGEVGTAA